VVARGGAHASAPYEWLDAACGAGHMTAVPARPASDRQGTTPSSAAAAGDRPIRGEFKQRTRGPSDRPLPSAAPRSDPFPDQLATPKVAGQTGPTLSPAETLAKSQTPNPQGSLVQLKSGRAGRVLPRSGGRRRRRGPAGGIAGDRDRRPD
jgi:hypothetical protein